MQSKPWAVHNACGPVVEDSVDKLPKNPPPAVQPAQLGPSLPHTPVQPTSLLVSRRPTLLVSVLRRARTTCGVSAITPTSSVPPNRYVVFTLTNRPSTRMVTRQPPFLRGLLLPPSSSIDHLPDLLALQLQKFVDRVFGNDALGTSEEQSRTRWHGFGEDADVVVSDTKCGGGFVAGDCGDEFALLDVRVGDGELLCRG